MNIVKSSEESTKKAYESPRLMVYGDLREITQNQGTRAMNYDNVLTGKKTG